MFSFALIVALNADWADGSYATIYGTNSRLKESHSFAAFVQIKNGVATDRAVISWGPAPGTKRIGARPGINYTLEESLCRYRNLCVTGPFKISDETFCLAKRQEAILCSGEVRYKALDRRRRGVNCIHAISDLVPGRHLRTGTAFGHRVNRLLAENLK